MIGYVWKIEEFFSEDYTKKWQVTLEFTEKPDLKLGECEVQQNV